MILPKYKYYVGKNVTFTVLREHHYYNDGFFIDNAHITQYASELVRIAEDIPHEDVRPGYRLTNNDGALLYFDKDRKFIGLYAFSGSWTIPANAVYMALRYKVDDERDYCPAEKELNLYFLASVEPHYKTLSKKYTKENGQMFFRESLDGKINLFGQDFDLIRSSDIESQFIFAIDKYDTVKGNWVEYYRGLFTKTDCKFDDAKKNCELKLNPVDDYNNVLDKYDNTYDLIKLCPHTIGIDRVFRPAIQIYVLGGRTVTTLIDGLYFDTEVNEVIDDENALKNTYHFGYWHSGNEFFIRGSKIPAINQTYAGGSHKYKSEDGRYICDLKYHTFNNDQYYIYDAITQEVLYESNRVNVGASYIKAGTTIRMTNVKDSSDTFVLEGILEIQVYARMLCQTSISDAHNIKRIPYNDFTNHGVYIYCFASESKYAVTITAKKSDTPTRYGIDDNGRYFTPGETGIAYNVTPICKGDWANSSIWISAGPGLFEVFNNVEIQFVLKDCFSIGDTIKALLKEIDPSIKHEETAEYSKVLYGDVKPFAMDNFKVHITQKSNALKGLYSQSAQKAEISFKKIMDMLRDCFRCYWYIDNGKLKIEHVSYFMNGGSYSAESVHGIDFTKLEDAFNKKPTSYFQTSLEFDKSELSARYEFKWMDDVTDAFGNTTVDIESNYIQKDKNEDVSVGSFTSEVDYMLANPDNFSKDGFALLCPVKENGILRLPIISSVLQNDNGYPDEIRCQNWYASWPYLIKTFYTRDMPAKKLKCNTLGKLIATGVKKCMRHTIELTLAEDIGLGAIKTSYGIGQIEEISYNLDTRLAKVKLAYGPK